MTKPMTEQEAVDWLLKRAIHDDDCAKEAFRPIDAPEQPCSCGGDAALAALDGVNIYGSRFKHGDVVWCYGDDGVSSCTIEEIEFDVDCTVYYKGYGSDGDWWALKDSDCFPTREEAEAECKRRNEAKPTTRSHHKQRKGSTPIGGGL